MSSTAILLITSAQNDLLHPSGRAWPMVRSSVEKNRVPDRLGALARAARAAGVVVVHSPVAFDYASMAGFQPRCAIQKVIVDNTLLAQDTDGSAFVSAIEPAPEDIVLRPRQGFSSFWAKTIQGELERLGAHTIYIAGMLAEGCVEAHARDAVENGHRPIVISDAIGSTSLELLDASLQTLALHAAALQSTKQTIAAWQS